MPLRLRLFAQKNKLLKYAGKIAFLFYQLSQSSKYAHNLFFHNSLSSNYKIF